MKTGGGDMDKELSDREFLFVVTYGRSGSTLVMGVLDSIDGFSVCGENNRACEYLYDFYMKYYGAIHNYNNNNMPRDSRNSWYQVCDFSRLKQNCRDFLWNMLSSSVDDRVVGFKEIRWAHEKFGTVYIHSGFKDYIAWLNIVFSPCKFLFVTRNLDDTCKSAWHVSNKDCKKNLQVFEKQVFDFIDRNPHIDFEHVHFDNLYSVSPADFKPMFVWLDEEYDEEKIQAVLDKKHSYAGKVKKS